MMLSLALAKFSFVLSRFFGDSEVLSMIRRVDSIRIRQTLLYLTGLGLLNYLGAVFGGSFQLWHPSLISVVFLASKLGVLRAEYNNHYLIVCLHIAAPPPRVASMIVVACSRALD